MHSQRSKTITFATLFFVLVIDAMSFSLTLPILAPLFLDSHHGILPALTTISVRNTIYGITLALFFLSAFIGAPFFGDSLID